MQSSVPPTLTESGSALTHPAHRDPDAHGKGDMTLKLRKGNSVPCQAAAHCWHCCAEGGLPFSCSLPTQGREARPVLMLGARPRVHLQDSLHPTSPGSRNFSVLLLPSPSPRYTLAFSADLQLPMGPSPRPTPRQQQSQNKLAPISTFQQAPQERKALLKR